MAEYNPDLMDEAEEGEQDELEVWCARQSHMLTYSPCLPALVMPLGLRQQAAGCSADRCLCGHGCPKHGEESVLCKLSMGSIRLLHKA